MTNDHYIVWDGQTIKDFPSDAKLVDYAFCHDGLLSIQEIRELCIKGGMEPIIIFSCKSGQVANEIEIPGEGWHGLWNFCKFKLLNQDPNISIRMLISEANRMMANLGFDQTAEVICREDLLDIPYFQDNENLLNDGKRIGCLDFDICRTSMSREEVLSLFISVSGEGQKTVKTGTDELVDILQSEIPSAKVYKFQGRSLDLLFGVVIELTKLGTFAALWKTFEFWITRHSDSSIKITYESEDNKQIEIVYSNLSKSEVKNILHNNPPKLNKPIKAAVLPNKKTG